MDIVSRAVCFAAEAFDGQRRKSCKTPAVLHGTEVAQIVASMSADDDTVAAAILHDVVEDAGVSVTEIKALFGPRTAQLVAAETEDKRPGVPPADSWLERKREAVRLLQKTSETDVKKLFLADKLSNMRSLYAVWLRDGDAVWESFNQKDPEKHHWYYRAIADALKELSDYTAWREYDWLIKEMFETVRQEKNDI